MYEKVVLIELASGEFLMEHREKVFATLLVRRTLILDDGCCLSCLVSNARMPIVDT